MKAIKITPSFLHGEIKAPPSKSISHRLLICSCLAEGLSTIKNISYSEDILATKNAILSLGAEIKEIVEPNYLETGILSIRGNKFPLPLENTIDCCESGSTLRFLIPLAALTNKAITFTGKEGLSQRPLSVFQDIFNSQNLNFTTNQGRLPFSLQGPLKPGLFSMRGDISSQFLSGLLFALPLLDGDSVITMTTPLESKGYLDLTIDALKKFAISIENNNYLSFQIRGGQRYQPTTSLVEGDFSQAAFWLVGGILGKKIKCLDLNKDSLQGDKAILEILTRMGAQLSLDKGSVQASPSPTRGITIDASECPDLVPILAVLGALSQGITTITNAKRLRIKESDRLEAISRELTKLGANIQETLEGLIIKGQANLTGGIVDSQNDHRIAMALAIAAIKCKEPVTILNSNSVNKSYPAFWQDYSKLGGHLDEFVLRQ